MWTHFMDMHSGGGTKEEPYQHIYIEAAEDEAKVIFYNRFDHSPDRVSCTCCGEDYSVSSGESLEQLTAYDRGCTYDNSSRQYVESERYPGRGYQTLDEYRKRSDVLFVDTDQIKPDERVGDVPEQGYVWVG